MAKRGRPKSLEKTRQKSVKLTLKANAVYRKVRRKRPNWDFSRYVSECLINDFCTQQGKAKHIKRLIGRENQKIKETRKRIEALSEEYRNLTEPKTIQEERLENAN